MPKTVNVTVILTFPVDVPASWVQSGEYDGKIQDAIEIDVCSFNKKVVLGDVDITFDGLEPEDDLG